MICFEIHNLDQYLHYFFYKKSTIPSHKSNFRCSFHQNVFFGDEFNGDLYLKDLLSLIAYCIRPYTVQNSVKV